MESNSHYDQNGVNPDYSAKFMCHVISTRPYPYTAILFNPSVCTLCISLFLLSRVVFVGVILYMCGVHCRVMDMGYSNVSQMMSQLRFVSIIDDDCDREDLSFFALLSHCDRLLYLHCRNYHLKLLTPFLPSNLISISIDSLIYLDEIYDDESLSTDALDLLSRQCPHLWEVMLNIKPQFCFFPIECLSCHTLHNIMSAFFF